MDVKQCAIYVLILIAICYSCLRKNVKRKNLSDAFYHFYYITCYKYFQSSENLRNVQNYFCLLLCTYRIMQIV